MLLAIKALVNVLFSVNVFIFSQFCDGDLQIKVHNQDQNFLFLI